ncbi:MAG: DUF2279 domain-containing protein [Candidatus Neomarinimicrobiota bacterium]
MKIWRPLILILLICTGLSAVAPVNVFDRKTSDKWFAMDKLKHFSTSLYMTTTMFYTQRRIIEMRQKNAALNSIGITISLGILKEVRDGSRKNNYFSWRDLTADVLGAGVAMLILNRIE